MATYPVRNKKTGEEKEIQMSIHAWDQWREDNPDWERFYTPDNAPCLGVEKECARFVLPLATPTKMYMSGSVRSWIHYIELRSANGTQKEHMDIANSCKDVFKEQFPVISEALEW